VRRAHQGAKLAANNAKGANHISVMKACLHVWLPMNWLWTNVSSINNACNASLMHAYKDSRKYRVISDKGKWLLKQQV